MPRPRRQAKARSHVLTPLQYMDLVGPRLCAFADEDDRRAAWEMHRVAIMERFLPGRHGMRPAAFWQYDCPPELSRRGPTVEEHHALEAARLAYLDIEELLGDEERAALVRHYARQERINRHAYEVARGAEWGIERGVWADQAAELLAILDPSGDLAEEEHRREAAKAAAKAS